APANTETVYRPRNSGYEIAVSSAQRVLKPYAPPASAGVRNTQIDQTTWIIGSQGERPTRISCPARESGAGRSQRGREGDVIGGGLAGGSCPWACGPGRVSAARRRRAGTRS